MQVAVEDRAQLTQALGQNAAKSSASASVNRRAGNANSCEYSWFILFLSVASLAFQLHFLSISVPFVPITEKKVLIEINDSDDEMQAVKAERQEDQAQNGNDVSNVVSSATNANVGITSNDGPNVLVKIPATNLSAVSFDPNQRGGKSNAETASSSTKANESQSDTRQKRTKSGQFKCKYCKYGSNLRGNLRLHEKMHIREDSMGFARNPNDGLLHCSHCPDSFKQLRGMLSHMQKYHTKNH